MEIYQPAEDSFFLNEFVEKEIKENSNAKVLDMGSGSGIQAETLLDKGISPKNVFLADINPAAVKFLRNKFPQSEVILSDLFSEIKNKKYDLIIFNPPYLPDNKFDKNADTSGGKEGSEIINRFLIQAKKYLSNKGIILLLTSSFAKNINWKGYDKKLLGKKRIFFEELYVWRLTNR